MRVFLTGASGFVGSNIAHVFAEHGAELLAPSRAQVDVTDADAVARSVAAFAPDAVVHCAILKDFGRLYTHRCEAFGAYVGATRNVVDAANAAGAQVVLVSTDWVFDGTQSGATETEPPNPINAYGFLKAASELVVQERANHGAVARVAGVNGVHRARPGEPLVQDPGFGNFVTAVVDALRAGRRHTVWEGPQVNTIATPTLATDAAELMWRIVENGLIGIFHCCGGEAVERTELARRAAAAFGLSAGLLDYAPPPPDVLPPGPIPYDTSLDATATAAALGVQLPDLDTTLARLRAELDGMPA